MNAKSGSLVALGLFLGLVVSALLGAKQPAAVAGGPLPNPPARFQVSAFGDVLQYGCYVIDTNTGQLFLSLRGQPLEKSGTPIVQ